MPKINDANNEVPAVNLEEQGSAPATPAAGNYKLYAKSDGKLYGKNDSGEESDLTVGDTDDHGALTGLGDDDHTQYHNDARGDARYYTKAQVDSSLSGKANTPHGHVASDVSDFDTEVSNHTDVSANTAQRHAQGSDTLLDSGNPNEVTAAALRTHLDDAGKHREIDDAGSGVTDLWSASKISSDLSGKAASSHTHTESEITDLDHDAVKIQGVPVSGTPPANTQVLAFNETSGEYEPTAPAAGGASDHGALTGLADDDHTQYHTDARGDARYYTQAQVDSALSGKAASSHTHPASDVTDFDTEVGNHSDVAANTAARHAQGSDVALDTGNANEVTAADLRAHLDDADKHREINDIGTGANDLWSASKINTELGGKAASSHAHAAGDVTSGTFDDARIAQSNVTQHEGAIDHGSIAGLADDDHTQYHTDARGDARYYTQAQVDSALSGKAASSHTHPVGDVSSFNLAATAAPIATDDSGSGYTPGSIWVDLTNDKAYICLDASVGAAVWTEITIGDTDTTDHGALTGLGDDDHTQYHTDARGDARYYTQAQVDSALSGKAASSHTHPATDVTDFDTEVSNNTDVAANTAARHSQGSDVALDTGNANEVTAADLRAHLDDAGKHREIDDLGSLTTDLWSANKISSELSGKAASSHTHVKADVTDLETITTTPGASAVPKADGSGKIANGWLNTGSGNGLDADTLDGNEATAFAAASHNHAASAITSGALALERGGTEADLSAAGPGALVQASAGAAVTVETLDETRGGTGQSSFATGDLLYASASNTLSKLTAGSDGEVLTLASGLPSWAAASGGSGNPSGAILLWSTDTAPTGYLLCDGSAVDRTTYSTLFGVIGTTYGSGDGSTTFNVPDMRGRFALGQDDMGGTSADRVTNAQADTLGGSAGSETHTLTEAEMPSHTHNIQQSNKAGGGANGVREGSPYDTPIGDTGGGSAHNNMPPYLTLNYIIKT